MFQLKHFQTIFTSACTLNEFAYIMADKRDHGTPSKQSTSTLKDRTSTAPNKSAPPFDPSSLARLLKNLPVNETLQRKMKKRAGYIAGVLSLVFSMFYTDYLLRIIL